MREVRVLLDACVGYDLEEALTELGGDVAHMLRISPSMPDRQVLALATSMERLLITLDVRFSDLVFVHGMPHAGVLLVREPDLVPARRALLVRDIIQTHYPTMVGHFSTLSRGRLRIHRKTAR